MATILQTLQSYITGGSLSLPASAFPGQIQSVLNEYFPQGLLTATGVAAPTQDGSSVQISSATCTAQPLDGMTFNATFAPDTNNPAITTLVLTATPPSGWTLATGWPLLGGAVFGAFTVSNATLTLTSSATSTAAAGIAFSGTLNLPTAWSTLQFLFGSASSLTCSGTIGQSGTAPSFRFSLPIASSVTVPLLGSLTASIVMDSVPIPVTAPPPNNMDGTYIPYIAATGFGVSSTISLAGTNVGVWINLSNPSVLIPITFEVASLATVALTDFASLLPPGTTLASLLPSTDVFNPGSALVPESVTLFLDPAGPSITSVNIVLGSPASWPILTGVELSTITLQFTVPASGPATGSVLGVLNVSGGDILLGLSYPPLTLTGALAEDTSVDLDAFLGLLLPSAPSFPLFLDDLDFSIQPAAGMFSLSTGLSGAWSITTGVAKVALTNAWMQLETFTLDEGTAEVMGSIGATVNIGSPSVATFTGVWRLPGGLTLEGSLPSISLSTIASSIAGTTLPTGVSDIAFTDGLVKLAADPATGNYGFLMEMTASVGGTAAGTGAVAVQQASSGFGVLAAFAGGTWTPSTTWPSLSALGDLTISDAGLVVSTLPAGTSIAALQLDLPGLPALTDPGFAFFGTVSLSGSILGPLASLFPSNMSFSLLGQVDTADPASTQVQAIFSGSSTTGAVTFTGVTVTIVPQSETCSVTASAALEVSSTDTLTLSGTGSITAGTTPSMSLLIEIANWENAFGFSGFTIEDFGLQIGYEDDGVTVAILGSFDIGTAPNQFTFTISAELVDLELPGAILFDLDSTAGNTLMLSDILSALTSVDLSNVPVLNSIGFSSLDFYVVDNPNGYVIDGYSFPPGIGISADITIYSWEAAFDLEVSPTSLIASGSINNAITIADVFTLSDSTGTTGPSASINTTASPYFTLDGQVSFLGISASVDAEATGSTFDFSTTFAFLDTVTATLDCQLVNATSFTASSSIGYSLDATIGPVVINGQTLIPQTQIQAAATVALSLAIDSANGVQLSGTLSFAWSNQTWSPQFTLSASDIGNALTNLESALQTWLQNNAATVFASLFSTAGNWITFVGLIGVAAFGPAGTIALVLASYFGSTASDTASFLHALGFAFLTIVGALVDVFLLSMEAAAAIVSALFDGGSGGSGCSVENGQNLAYGVGSAAAVTTRDLRFALTSTERGRQLLNAYYEYGEEIWSLLSERPYLRHRLAALERSPQGATDLDRLGDAVIRALTEVAPHASAPLRRRIVALLPELARYRTLTHAGLLAELAS